MTDNVYQAPSAELLKTEPEGGPAFYIVSTRKFWILFIATLSLYHLYWHYRHWSNYRSHSGTSLWPVPRALFSLFFVHSLFQKIDNRRAAIAPDYVWSPTVLATWFVISALANSVCSRLVEREIGLPYTLFAFIVSVPLTGWCMYRAQKAANRACQDPYGESNHRLTLINYVWLALFALAWALLITGVAVTYPDY